jgi:hypothetical protein
VTTLERILDVLPPPYSVAADSTLAAVIGLFALEFDTLGEDIDRLRRTHWINQAYRFEDATKLGALLGIPPLPGDAGSTARGCAAGRQPARRSPGAKIFAPSCDYLLNAEDALDATFVPGMPADEDKTFQTLPTTGRWRPLELAENPPRCSQQCCRPRGSVPHLLDGTQQRPRRCWRRSASPACPDAAPPPFHQPRHRRHGPTPTACSPAPSWRRRQATPATRAARATLDAHVTHKLRA